jgi:membrane protease YdiL (CAAX protease family)
MAAKSLGSFRAALLIGWMALAAAGVLFARFRDIPGWAAGPVLAAFLVEYPFYLVPAFPELRKRLSGMVLPLYLLASLLLPYLVCYVATGQFLWVNLIKLAALALALGLWYRVLPVTVVTDLAFLTLVGSLLLGNYFDRIYLDPYPKLKIAILGRIALFQITVLALLIERRVQDPGYGFIPNWREWRIGALHYLYFLPVAACLALPLRAVRFVPPAPLWKTAGIFLGFFWVVALFEEFVFRGVLQQWLEEWRWSRAASLAIASVIFGSVHLWFRNFPNWRWALIAAALGWFCGRARNQAGSIRAGVVTHALVVATWREFFV